MKTRIAVYTQTRSNWGGSFQYAKAFVEALAGLDRELFDVQVWHDDDEWHILSTRLGFASHFLSHYDFPPQFLPAAKKILAALLSSTLGESQRREMMQSLQPFSAMTKLTEWKPHVVIGPQMGGQHYVQGARHITAIHDLMHRYETRFPEVGTPEVLKSRESLFTGMIERSDAILVDSKAGKRHVQECYRQVREEQLRILPFAAFGEILDCVPRKPEFSLPEKFFFYPSQFWLHKNHSGLARAVGRLAAQYPDIHVLAAGNTAQNGFEDFQRVVQAKSIEHCFTLPGYISVEEMAWCYRNARALVMPTFFGPTNIPPLEAMALGCPVAISGIYGMPEQCGEAALYFPPDAIPAMAAVLERLWTDDALCEDLRRKGLARTRLCNQIMFNKQVLHIVRDLAEKARTEAGDTA